MSSLVHVEIVTPTGMIFKGDVKMVVLPGSEGEFGVLKGHASLLSSLKHELIAIDSGYAKVDEFKVEILAKGAVSINGSDESEIAQHLEQAKELIRSMSSDNVALASTFANIDKRSGLK